MAVKLKLAREVEARVKAEAESYNISPEELITRRLLLTFPSPEEQERFQPEMRESGLFMQKLDDGGILCVTSEGWEIRYTIYSSSYWSGNKVNIFEGEDLECFIYAVEEAWNELQRLKPLIPENGTASTKTSEGIVIRIGVKKSSINLPIQKTQLTTHEEIDELFRFLLATRDKAVQVMNVMDAFF